jgi:hypothetical protein
MFLIRCDLNFHLAEKPLHVHVDNFWFARDTLGTRNFVVDFPRQPTPVNFTRSEALQFRDSIRVAAAVPKFPLRLK